MTDKQELEKLIEYNVHEEMWTVFLFTEDEISTTETANFIKAMDYIRYRAEQVTVKINCTGGDVHNGLAIYDYIKGYPLHTEGVVYGNAMSMGAVILQAFDERVLMPHSKLMLHGIQTELPYDVTSNNAKWIKESMKDNEELMNIFYERMKEKRPRYRLKSLKDKFKEGDWIVSAKQAVQLGLADEVREVY